MNDKKASGIVVGLIALVVAAAVGVWALNSGDDTKTETSKTSTTQTEESKSTMKEEKDIVGLASDTASLSTLVTAVKAAGLVETLQGTGPFTVLAPPNDAFAALPAGTLDTLLKPENVEQLKGILTYHVIAGKVMAADLKDGQVVTTVQGGTLTVKLMDGKAYFVDAKGTQAMVASADVMAKNGVVHVIDHVLLPQ